MSDVLCGDEIILVPIPKRLYSVVINALSSALQSETSIFNNHLSNIQVTEDSADTESPDTKIDWCDSGNMKRLRKSVEGRAIVMHLFDMTADAPGQWIAFSDIYSKAGYHESRQARASLGALTKVIKRDFGVDYDHAVWPVQQQWAMKGDAQKYYRMTQDVADAWKASLP